MKFKKTLSTVLLVILMLIFIGGVIYLSPSKTVVNVTIPVEVSLADRVEQVMPAVVHIRNIDVGCQGSGFIVSEDGIVVTAKHVVEGGSHFLITLNNGDKYATEIVIEDEEHDIAFLKLQYATEIVIEDEEHDITFLKLPTARYPFLSLSSILPLRVGDDVFIAGSPFGFDNFNSVSTGIVSSLQRDIDAERDYGYGWGITFQTDSAANPGNSGGPVFNMNGECIGVLVAGMSEGVNYSVPVSVFMDDLYIIRIMLGMQRFDERMEREYYDEYYEWKESSSY